jgi:cytochrome c553
MMLAGIGSGLWAGDVFAAPDVALGEYLAGECVTCHQRSGRGDGIPSIVGWPAESFIAVIASYKSKERDNVVMQTIAARLKDDEIQALAAYFESLGPRGPASVGK